MIVEMTTRPSLRLLQQILPLTPPQPLLWEDLGGRSSA